MLYLPLWFNLHRLTAEEVEQLHAILTELWNHRNPAYTIFVDMPKILKRNYPNTPFANLTKDEVYNYTRKFNLHKRPYSIFDWSFRRIKLCDEKKLYSLLAPLWEQKLAGQISTRGVIKALADDATFEKLTIDNIHNYAKRFGFAPAFSGKVIQMRTQMKTPKPPKIKALGKVCFAPKTDLSPPKTKTPKKLKTQKPETPKPMPKEKLDRTQLLQEWRNFNGTWQEFRTKHIIV